MLLHTIRIKRMDLDSPQRITSPAANFDQLSWVDEKTGRVMNSGNPFIAQTVNAPPFEKGKQLGAGVHLHLILPQELTRFSDNPEEVKEAPNRWLIRKCDEVGKTSSWVLESDFLSEQPAVPGRIQSTTVLPHTTSFSGHQRNQRFRYMGRVSPLEEYINRPFEKAQYWKAQLGVPFTAFAHGDVHFAAFYPNCCSVFGFYDPAGKPTDRYEVCGWYERENGEIVSYLKEINNILAEKSNRDADLTERFSLRTDDRLRAFLREQKGHSFFELLFFGTAEKADESTELKTETWIPAIGNGADEALSAFLADAVARTDAEKNRLERELEALHFGYLKQQSLDVAANFESGRHQKGFVAEQGAFLFDLQLVQNTKTSGDLSENKEYPFLSPVFSAVKAAVEELNGMIVQQEKREAEVEDQQRMLFSHWQKYLQCAHPPLQMAKLLPDPNEVLDFIANNVVPELKQRLAKAGKLTNRAVFALGEDTVTSVNLEFRPKENKRASKRSDSSGVVFWNYLATLPEFITPINNEPTHAERIIRKLTEIKQLIAELNATELKTSQQTLSLQHRQGQTYYTPAEPVLVLASEHLNQLAVEGEDAQPVSVLSVDPSFHSIHKWLTSVQELPFPLFDLKPVMTERATPIFLDWEAFFFPVEKIGGQRNEYGKYFLSDCFEIQREDAEFSLIRDGKTQYSNGISRYCGRTLPVFSDASNIRTKLAALTGQQKTPALTAANQVLKKNRFLVQTLNGFNASFVQEKVLMQLPIDDPIAFEHYRSIFNNLGLAELIGEHRFHSPEPEFDFSPVRSGGLHISLLELIDTFGRATSITPQPSDLRVPEVMQLSDRKGLQQSNIPDIHAFLYPRFIQSTALSVNWLSATSSAPIHTAATNLNPVCGWIVPNFMAQALAIYSPEGEHLCNLLERNGRLRYEPGPERDQYEPEAVTNTYMKQLLDYFEKQADIREFLRLLQDSLLFIDPETGPQHNDLNYLFGRPLALVRMRINFETKGTYASRKDHQAFRSMLETRNPAPLTAGYEYVRIPLQVGDYSKLNEGVILYWTGSDLSNQQIRSAAINTEIQTEIGLKIKPKLHHALKSNPLDMTLLMDPRAEAHICSGVVPLKIMQLEEQFWKPVLQHLRIDFDMGPALFPRGEIRLNLPASSEYGWAWLKKSLDANKQVFFSLTPQLPAISKAVFEQEIANNEWLSKLHWELLTESGIIEPLINHPSTAFVKFEKCTVEASGLSEPILETLLAFFDRFCTRIDPVETEAIFKPNELHDGWLELFDTTFTVTDKPAE